MKHFRMYPALFYLLADGLLKGSGGNYVDDLLRGSGQEFKKVSEKTKERFEMADEIPLPTEFSSFILNH